MTLAGRGRRLIERISAGFSSRPPLAGSIPAREGPGSLLRGHVDDPRPGAIELGTSVVVRGWHLWGDQPVVAVAFSIEGRVVGHATTGSEARPDVAKALGSEHFAEAGWHGVIDVPGTAAVELSIAVWPAPGEGPIELEPLRIRFARGDRPPLEPAIDNTPDRFHGALELPEESAIEYGAVNFVGWALTDRRPVTQVEILVDGTSTGRARLGLQRPDVGRHYRAPHGEMSGFEHLVDISHWSRSDAPVTVEVLARALDGRSEIVAKRRFRFTPVENLDDRSARAVVLRHRLDGIRSSYRRADDLNLVVFTHDLGYGGGQLWLSEMLVRSGAGTRYACTVVSPSGGPLLSEFEARGIEVHTTQAYPAQDIEQYEGRIMETAQWLASRSHNAALVNTFGAFFGADAANRLGLPTVWAIHESWPPPLMWSAAYPPGFVDPLVRQAAYQALGATGALVFEAERTRAQFEPWATKRAVVVPYGIATEEIGRYMQTVSRAQARRAVGLAADNRVLLVMGTTERRKGQTLLAEAFAGIARRHPDARLVFVGDTGTPYAESLARFIRRAGIGRQVRLVPLVEDTFRWYRAADFLVGASDVESLPRSALEGMCFGVPIVATSVFGLIDLITDNETGLLYEPLDLAATIEALERALALTPTDAAQIGEAGRALVLERYDSSGYAADIVALLEGLRDDPARTPDQILGGDRPPA